MPPQLIALLTSISYATALVSARRGLSYSTPATVTCFSVVTQNVLLWTALFARGGIPKVSPAAVLLFVLVGVTQFGVRIFAYTGVHKIGASRSSALQAVSPLIATIIAVVTLREKPGLAVITGTLLVVGGIILLSWKAERQISTFRWWHLLLPLGAACLTGMNHPIRRYALSLSNEPLFFAALMGAVSLLSFMVYLPFSPAGDRLIWNRSAVWPFVITGVAETLSILFIITALSMGAVSVVAPIAATYPVWALLGAAIFLRKVEQINLLTVLGTLSVVTGTVAIILNS
jgi:drug/metabolite transporter (DMT)-like permease